MTTAAARTEYRRLRSEYLAGVRTLRAQMGRYARGGEYTARDFDREVARGLRLCDGITSPTPEQWVDGARHALAHWRAS